MPGRDRPLAVWLLGLLLGQLAVRAVVGGGALVVAPSGTLVGVPLEPLSNTPVSDFFLPGLVLLLGLGLVPAVVCYGLYATRWWAWYGTVFIGVSLLLWLFVEVAIGYVRPTVYWNLLTAIGILALTIHPSVRLDLGVGSAAP